MSTPAVLPGPSRQPDARRPPRPAARRARPRAPAARRARRHRRAPSPRLRRRRPWEINMSITRMVPASTSASSSAAISPVKFSRRPGTRRRVVDRTEFVEGCVRHRVPSCLSCVLARVGSLLWITKHAITRSGSTADAERHRPDRVITPPNRGISRGDRGVPDPRTGWARACPQRLRIGLAMAVADVPFDLVEVKLAAPLTRPGTVAKADVIARLCAVERRRSRPWSRRPGTARRRCLRGGPRPIRVRSRGSRSTAETTTPWCSCATSRPRSTASSRSRPRCSTRCRAQADRPGRSASRASGARWPRSSTRWCSCSTICTPSPIRPVWTCSRRCSSTFRPARRSRSRAGKSRRCRSPAGGRRDGCTRSAWRTSGSTSRRPSCCSRRPESSSTRASSPS